MRRPDPIQRYAAQPVDLTTTPGHAAASLLDGATLLVTDRYGTGVEILAALRSRMRPPPQSAPYASRKAFLKAWREVSLRLITPIEGHRLAFSDADPIGFLEELYPELPSFVLPFVQVQELHGAWSRYVEGVRLAVLGHLLHPFYGTYAPTRTSHLELFATWLSQHEGPRGRAIDVGTGCGVLALMLCKAGFESVLATDINPNAIESVARELKRRPTPPPIELLHGDLLGDDPTPADLVVFNPPWIRGEVEGLVDGALYFEDGLFERFFQQAIERLTPAGRIVLVFSTVMSLVQPDVPHPILAELDKGRLRLVNKLQRKVKPPAGDGPRRRTKERVEVWELARVDA